MKEENRREREGKNEGRELKKKRRSRRIKIIVRNQRVLQRDLHHPLGVYSTSNLPPVQRASV